MTGPTTFAVSVVGVPCHSSWLSGRATRSCIFLARRNRCAGIKVQPVQSFCEPSAQRWAFEATVYKSKTCRGFVGYGDADPSNVSPLVRGAEMRVAETRAVNRALRKAYGIGICSVEEVGSFAGQPDSGPESKKLPQPANGNGNYGGRTVRDRKTKLIGQEPDARSVRLQPNEGSDSAGGRNLFAVQSGRYQFRHGQSPESVSDCKTVRGAADNSAAASPRLAHHVAHEIEVHCVGGGPGFGPLRFEEFQTSADVNHEVHPFVWGSSCLGIVKRCIGINSPIYQSD